MSISSSASGHLANSAVVLSWIAWFFSHIDDVNKVLQFVALLFAIGASAAAIRYHTKNRK